MRKTLKHLITFTDDYQNREEIILRDHLAMERTKLANERTLLSYLRTSLYLILGGIAFVGMTDSAKFQSFGYFSLALSILVLVIGIFRYYQLKKHLRRIYEPLNGEKKE